MSERHLMSKRPRTSTIVLAVVFLGVLALYILVRPVPVTAADQPTGTHTSGPSPTPSASSPVHSPSPSRSPHPSRSPSPSRSATPAASATPSVAATPSSSSSPVSGSPGPSPTSSLP
jgi:cytoskeletal protein RodZ